MKSSAALVGRRQAAINRLAVHFPHLTEPTIAVVDEFSSALSNIFAEVGALSVAIGEYATARQWFDLALRSHEATFRKEVSAYPGWPTPKMDPHPVIAAEYLPNLIFYGSLVHRTPTQAPFFPEISNGLGWIIRALDERMALFFLGKPDVEAGPNSNSALFAIRDLGMFPAAFLQMDSLTSVVLERLERYEAWHQAIGVPNERLESKGFGAPRAIQAYKSLLSRDSRTFVSNLERSSRLGRYTGNSAYKAKCDPRLLALYLRANEWFGPLPIPKGQGFPPSLDVERYWAEAPSKES